jgi:hypothetical protein
VESAVRRALKVGADTVITLQVEESRARDLESRLDSLFVEGRAEVLHCNSAYDLKFVHHPDTYWFGHNSNQVVAEWLRELGISVRGLTLFSPWKVEPPETPADSITDLGER